jgi:predicted nucleic acid-binding protein
MGRAFAERRLMTRFLLDTTFLIDVLNEQRGRYEVMKSLATQQHELACCPINVTINVTEVYSGMRGAETPKTEALLRSLEYIPITLDAAKLAGELRQLWARKGKTFSVPDMMIAAVCISEKLTLITDNRKDFTMPELTLYALP